MSQELKKLKKIGAQKIHQDTHIAFVSVQSVIHESFEELEKIQFTGFISILEREYNLDLSTLRNKGLAYFLEKNGREGLNTKIFVSPKEKKSFTSFYILISLLIFIIAVYYTTTQSKIETHENSLDDSAIENATQNIIPKEEPIFVTDINTSENNTTIEVNQTQVTPVKVIPIHVEIIKKNKKETSLTPKKLIISPKSRVWIGYINKKTGQKKQTVTRKEIILDASKVWLLSFGHTHIQVHIDDKLIKIPASNKSMRFLYKDNTFKALSPAAFKKLNKGRIW